MNAVVVGADAFSEYYFVNKVGTAALAICCEKLKIPFYVVGDSTKFLPNEIPLIHQEEHDPSEVWEDAPNGVQVKNPYFEKVPWGDEILITESGVNIFPSTEISDRLRDHFSRGDDGLF